MNTVLLAENSTNHP